MSYKCDDINLIRVKLLEANISNSSKNKLIGERFYPLILKAYSC